MSKLAGQHNIASGVGFTYAGVKGAFDELSDGPAEIRGHWRPLIDSLAQLGPQELEMRWENGRQILGEHGVSYNVYGDPEGMNRGWNLDLIPLLVTGEEWARLETGLIQRSRLFNLILADIYGGTQRLLRDGFLPPELVYGNPAFLRPCRGMQVPSQVYLHLQACDLGRSADGQWWVLSDRTQSPAGAGYAWENRTVMSRILPDQMRQLQVQPIAGFFERQREMLYQLAPQGTRQPCIVVLTPGPHNEAYFEHAFLARNLGFALVEGADLTVRERRVFLKTIEGLQPIDVILRRVNDAFCDPLELRGDSFLGVSGLLEATRAGKVTLANALGAGLLESPAFLAFLPGLCQHILDEELLLPSVATWWCGQGQELRYVIDHLNSLVLKSAFAGQTAFPPALSYPPRNRRALAEYRRNAVQQIEAAPGSFVAQERVKLSHAPVWIEDKLEPRAVVLRTYVVNGGEGFAVFPGGLVRFSKDANSHHSMQGGSDSKDAWVLSRGGSSGLDTTPPASVRARPSEQVLIGIPSRAADHLFWLGRYTERLEQMLRVLRCVLGRVSAEPGEERSTKRLALIQLAANLGLRSGASSLQADTLEISQHILGLLYHQDEPGGVRELLTRIRLSASAVRDRFSGDTWRILGRLEADARTRPGRLALASGTGLIHNLVLDLAAFSGMEMENMTRGQGWKFLDFGRRLERGLSMIKLLQAAVTVGTQSAVLEPVLEIADSVMTYRRQFFAAPEWGAVLGLVLRDESNPRSFAFQVNLLAEHTAAIVVDAKALMPTGERARIDSLVRGVREVELNELSLQHTQGRSQALLDVLKFWATQLSALSDQITSHYFNHSIPRISS